MTKTLRILSLAATVAATALTSAPALAQAQSTATANIKRPLTLTSIQNLNLGNILLSGTAPFSATVSVAQNGTLTCPASVTCSGTVLPARYNVRGSNNQVVLISAPNVTLTSGANNLTLTTSAPASVTLTSSGAPGDNFNIGGSITVADTTVDGVYNGTFNVTVSYQ